jgi:hypothetical protein
MSLPARLLAAAAVLWAVALPLAASTAARGPADTLAPFTQAMYAAGRIICHQRPERSFHLGPTALPVCARCLGLYAGAAVVALLMLGADATRRAGGTARLAPASARRLVAAAAVPSALTLISEWTTGGWPGNAVRATSGLVLGATVAWILLRVVSAGPSGRGDELH